MSREARTTAFQVRGLGAWTGLSPSSSLVPILAFGAGFWASENLNWGLKGSLHTLSVSWGKFQPQSGLFPLGSPARPELDLVATGTHSDVQGSSGLQVNSKNALSRSHVA